MAYAPAPVHFLRLRSYDCRAAIANKIDNIRGTEIFSTQKCTRTYLFSDMLVNTGLAIWHCLRLLRRHARARKRLKEILKRPSAHTLPRTLPAENTCRESHVRVEADFSELAARLCFDHSHDLDHHGNQRRRPLARPALLRHESGRSDVGKCERRAGLLLLAG